MPIDPAAPLVLTAYAWVPSFVHGLVRDVRIRWACEEAGLAYAEDLIDVRAKPDGYAALQPWRQVPALRDGETRWFETGAILLHLGESHPALLPAGGQARADAISWLLGALNSVEPGAMELANIAFFARNEEWAALRRPSLEESISARLAPVARRLADRDWLAGAFSIADIAMVHVLMSIQRAGERAGDLVASDPVLAAYLARGQARPAWQRALADQIATFERNKPKES
ncbi:glutathione S-transferase family protein [Croceicoccus sp. BE223]|uniref:glutathione S-transferase family protein n=1 Tax=Croceicoccus sp. BE223 TaxID=2817716 RepID=UPI002854A8CF|nr:glutathione S-transferase family protein [Croceicoccus sp. BE223]MDR7102764.1 glutathione S-transferase [Croceicoccus sp. BE223]